jgi:gamma-glutamylcyclotransferase (GGCT)/AIG2-like uncharacterized protein YtfP
MTMEGGAEERDVTMRMPERRAKVLLRVLEIVRPLVRHAESRALVDEGIADLTRATRPVRLFMYGSLKEGFYNFDRFGGQRVIQKGVRISGFTMLNLGSYPGAIRWDGVGPNGIVGEIHEFTPAAFEGVERMEIGAGYERQRVTTDTGESVELYLMTPEIVRIQHGWNKQPRLSEWPIENDAGFKSRQANRQTIRQVLGETG